VQTWFKEESRTGGLVVDCKTFSASLFTPADCIDRLCGEAVMRVNEEDAGTLCSLRQREVNEFERIFTVSSYERMLFLLELISLREEAGEGRR